MHRNTKLLTGISLSLVFALYCKIPIDKPTSEVKREDDIGTGVNRLPNRIDSSQLDDQYRDLLEKFVNISDEGDGNKLNVKKYIDDMVAMDTADMSLEARYLRSHFPMIQKFESFIYRCKDMVMDRDWWLIHNMLVTHLYSIDYALNIYAPYDEHRGLFRYISEPLNANKNQQLDPINTPAKLQDFARIELYPAIANYVSELASITTQLKNRPNPYMIWDNRYFTGSLEDYIDPQAQFRLLTANEMHLNMAAAYEALASINMFNAYNNDDLLKVVTKLGNVMQGIGGSLGSVKRFLTLDSRTFGGNAKDHADAIRDYPKYLTIRDRLPATQARIYPELSGIVPRGGERNFGQKEMNLAYNNLKSALKNVNYWWQGINSTVQTNNYLLWRPQRILPWKDSIQKRFETWNELLNEDQVAMDSVASSKVIILSLKNFFTTPPPDLKRFLPTEFDEGTKYKDNKLCKKSNPSECYNVTFRDFSHQRPIAWDLSVYEKYIPNIRQLDNEPNGDHQVKVAIRLAAQTWGGRILSKGMWKTLR